MGNWENHQNQSFAYQMSHLKGWKDRKVYVCVYRHTHEHTQTHTYLYIKRISRKLYNWSIIHKSGKKLRHFTKEDTSMANKKDGKMWSI